MLNSSEINVIGNIIDTTWGRYSTAKSPTVSIKASLSGDMLTLNYTTVVYFASEHAMSQQLPRYQDESAQVCNDYMKDLRKEFKESAGRALKVKEQDSSDSVEVIYVSSTSPRKTAYYRRVTTFLVS